MTAKPSQGLFITGTDTGVGKTYVAALLAKALMAAGKSVGVYKPAASGCRREGNEQVSDDALALWLAAGKPGTLSQVCPQRFAAPLAPHLAARAEGKEIDAALLRSGLNAWRDFDFVVVEGAGGLMSPLGDEDYVADLASEFGFPLLVVAPNRLGVVNQTLQTLITATAFRDGLEVAGIALNEIHPLKFDDPSRATNAAELIARCVPPLVAQVPWLATEISIDWLRGISAD